MLWEIGDRRRQPNRGQQHNSFVYVRTSVRFVAPMKLGKFLCGVTSLIMNRISEASHKKQLSRLTNVVGAAAALALITACQTVAVNDAELAASRKEFLLAQSGFKV